MELTSSPAILCVVLPTDRPTLKEFTPVWMCYQAGSRARLYRTHSPTAIRGGILMADDSHLTQMESYDWFCRQTVQECLARHALGFCANWSKAPTAPQRQLTSALETALTQRGLSLWVTEPYADCCTSAHVLISSAISGGTLRRRLCDAIAQYGAPRVTLAIECLSQQFPLPCPTGQGVPLTAVELQRHLDLHPTLHSAEEFCARYFTLCNDTQTSLVLFDTADTIQQKLRLARDLGLSQVMVAWSEWSGALPV